MSELTDRGKTFRAAIAGFIEARREAKLKSKADDADTASKYDYATWLADAARRVGQIQAVTHVLKATHPDARGSSLHVAPSQLPQHVEIGSHLLGSDYAEDVVGNAAALDVFKLLKLDVDGRRLLDWAQAGDADLQAALSDAAEQAQGWMQAFTSLVREETQPTSHPMAKQLYWLAGENPQDDAQYHLLQPMFSSTLAHAVHADIQAARFGEINKEARQARRDNKPGEHPYRDYRGLVARKLGGTKPQNISQLNSERGGVNYLFASLPPPAWAPRQGPDLRKLDSVFDQIRGALFWFGEVREHLQVLADFLKTNPDQNKETRDRVAASVQAIGQELAMFGTAVQGRYPAGWTRDADCRLPRCEQLWLDPDRTELPLREDADYPQWHEDDVTFQQAYDRGDWADEVATRFGLWLNGQLRKRSDELAVLGESEMRHFARQAILDVAWPIPLQRRAKAGAA
ncbi:MAG: type I-F CRISPR-associated protein Csy1 [Rhodanobacter sp.]|nr:MAG: type I-F CRISPR-associated protein Csy1 [Rhodanobacter sp.]TAM03071.1 MAG: type I-F CRISPR-associated protein Csy1 [Rhodanobacter sp.]TAM38637.1 MAG: type I-F CRISPR-associated protein Csy1 [Rhodanobacter sp.]TAN23662.1 MAG: type I-F CRISPR-associated protein Csy1 [Rhodanobacter sp.]